MGNFILIGLFGAALLSAGIGSFFSKYMDMGYFSRNRLNANGTHFTLNRFIWQPL